MDLGRVQVLGVGYPAGGVTVEGHECLVFFLGGDSLAALRLGRSGAKPAGSWVQPDNRSPMTCSTRRWLYVLGTAADA